jgi:hypothetical protein
MLRVTGVVFFLYATATAGFFMWMKARVRRNQHVIQTKGFGGKTIHGDRERSSTIRIFSRSPIWSTAKRRSGGFPLVARAAVR